MINRYQAVMNWLDGYPQVGRDLYFNFIDETNNDGNTTLATVPHGQIVRRYVDGCRLMKMQLEIRQIKPLATYSNTTANADQMQLVKEFLDWINEQGKKKNFPDWGECEIIDIKTPEEVKDPSLAGVSEEGALYGFPFEILYIERN